MSIMPDKKIDNIMKVFFERHPEYTELKFSDFFIEDGILYPKYDTYLYESLRDDMIDIIALGMGKNKRTDLVLYLTNPKTLAYAASAVEYGAYGMLLCIQPWLKEYFKKKGDL